MADATAGYRLRALLEPLRLAFVPLTGQGWQVNVIVGDDSERERALRAIGEWAAAEGKREVTVLDGGERVTLRAG